MRIQKVVAFLSHVFESLIDDPLTSVGCVNCFPEVRQPSADVDQNVENVSKDERVSDRSRHAWSGCHSIAVRAAEDRKNHVARNYTRAHRVLEQNISNFVSMCGYVCVVRCCKEQCKHRGQDFVVLHPPIMRTEWVSERDD